MGSQTAGQPEVKSDRRLDGGLAPFECAPSINQAWEFLLYKKSGCAPAEKPRSNCLGNKAGYTAQDAPSMRTFHLRK